MAPFPATIDVDWSTSFASLSQRTLTVLRQVGFAFQARLTGSIPVCCASLGQRFARASAHNRPFVGRSGARKVLTGGSHQTCVARHAEHLVHPRQMFRRRILEPRDG